MSKEERLQRRAKLHQAAKALRQELKDEATKAYVNQQRELYFQAGYKKGLEEGKQHGQDAEATDPAS